MAFFEDIIKEEKPKTYGVSGEWETTPQAGVGKSLLRGLAQTMGGAVKGYGSIGKQVVDFKPSTTETYEKLGNTIQQFIPETWDSQFSMRDKARKTPEKIGDIPKWLNAWAGTAAEQIPLMIGAVAGGPVKGLSNMIATMTGHQLDKGNEIFDNWAKQNKEKVTPEMIEDWKNINSQAAIKEGVGEGVIEYAGNVVGPVGQAIGPLKNIAATTAFGKIAKFALGVYAEGEEEYYQGKLSNKVTEEAIAEMQKKYPDFNPEFIPEDPKEARKIGRGVALLTGGAVSGAQVASSKVSSLLGKKDIKVKPLEDQESVNETRIKLNNIAKNDIDLTESDNIKSNGFLLSDGTILEKNDYSIDHEVISQVLADKAGVAKDKNDDESFHVKSGAIRIRGGNVEIFVEPTAAQFKKINNLLKEQGETKVDIRGVGSFNINTIGELKRQTDKLSKQEDPLIEEAKKYDSAEEFIDSQRDFRDSHVAPSFDDRQVDIKLEEGGDFSLSEVVEGKHNQPDDYFDPKVGARYYMYDDVEGRQSATAIDNIRRAKKAGREDVTITAYRVVPNDVKESKLQDGDWVSFSEKYAINHGESRLGKGNYKIIKQEVSPEEVWWDGNDIREWGYDTGKTEKLSRRQLTDIWNKAQETKEQKDEIKLYHGTNIQDIKSFKKGNVRHGRELGDGIYFFKNKDRAFSYGSNVVEASFNPEKLIDINSSKIINKKGFNDVSFIKTKVFNDIGQAKSFMEKLRKDNKFELIEETEDGSIKITYRENGANNVTERNFFRGIKRSYPQSFNQVLEESGYEGLNSEDVVVVFDPDKIKITSTQKEEQQSAQTEPKVSEESYKQNLQTKIKNKSDFKDLTAKVFEPVSTTLRKINPKLSDSIRKFEFNILKNTKQDYENAEGFLSSAKKLSQEDKANLDFALKNKDVAKVDEIIQRNGMQKEYAKLRETLDDIYNRAVESGIDISFLEDYFPRKIINSKEFMNYIQGTEQWSEIKRAIDEIESKEGILTDEERAAIANKMLRGFPQGKALLSKPGFAKQRSIEEITPELNRFYQDSSDALLSYIETMNSAIEANNLFGKNNKKMNESIGWYVNDLVKQGMINVKDEQRVRDIFTSRMNQRGPGQAIRLFKNMAYMYSLNNPGNAITQVGDLVWSLYDNGYYETFKALLGKKIVTKKDLGIDAISEEFRSPEKSAKAVSKLFNLIGLSGVDGVMKETFINAELSKMSKQAKNNDAGLKNEIIRVFGGENLDQIQKDLADKNITDEVLYLLFAKLSDFQPISMAEMPEQYIKGGNARIFYMLKSFTLKQIDIFRRETFETMKTDPKKGMSNLLRLSFAFVLMGATSDMLKDLLFNRPIQLNDLVVDNIFKLMAFSKWQIYQAKSDGLMKTLMMSILPPIPFVDDVIKDAIKIKEGKAEVKKLKTLRGLPVVGKMYYWWFGGGRDLSQKERQLTRRLINKRNVSNRRLIKRR